MAIAIACRNLSAVLLEHGASYDDIVPYKAVVQESVATGYCHRVYTARAAPFVTRIECTRGDAAAINIAIGGSFMHYGLAQPFDVPLALAALVHAQVWIESTVGPFEVRVTYGVTATAAASAAAAIATLHDACVVLWRYADGNEIFAFRGVGGLRLMAEHDAASPRALRA